ncbi:copper homeostasis periplasmic binding protein CopC [Luteibacter anthropi]|uniref:copper homeostasis periplasmic binding protein CopC n=1 Tax=Luteibacter anthropi TaxID=564369 RepID=UPI0020325660|nr:copper homeostasis periplasmic binding protein CopC [Luteibacter anthropi]URX61832.1 copper homeostasis periplasmic binding protein CopC [Luteibacter anthropi]
MHTFRSLSLALLAVPAFFASAAAFAHPKLVSSTPADKAEVSAPATVELTFSETLMPQMSGADVVITSMPGMPGMGAMKVGARASVSDDAKTLIVTPLRPLAPGAYRVDWHVVSTDTHAVKGTLTFSVK